MLDDSISRQAAIDEWKNDFKGYVNALNIPRDDYNGIMAYIDELPSSQPEQRWIPCEERQPEESGIYWTKDSFGSMRKRWYSTVDGWGRAKDMPTAWMPLLGNYS